MNKLAAVLLSVLATTTFACTRGNETGAPALEAKASMDLNPTASLPLVFVKAAAPASEPAPAKLAEAKPRSARVARGRAANAGVADPGAAPEAAPAEPAPQASSDDVSKGAAKRVVKPMSNDDPWNAGGAKTSMADSQAAGKAPMKDENPFTM